MLHEIYKIVYGSQARFSFSEIDEYGNVKFDKHPYISYHRIIDIDDKTLVTAGLTGGIPCCRVYTIDDLNEMLETNHGLTYAVQNLMLYLGVSAPAHPQNAHKVDTAIKIIKHYMFLGNFYSAWKEKNESSFRTL